MLDKKLLYISTAISIGDYDAKNLIENLDEAIEEVRETTFVYSTKSTHPERKEHLPTFRNYALSNKARLISKLEDVQKELKAKRPNNRFMLFLLKEVVNTGFFTNKLQEKMLLDMTTTRKVQLQNEKVRV